MNKQFFFNLYLSTAFTLFNVIAVGQDWPNFDTWLLTPDLLDYNDASVIQSWPSDIHVIEPESRLIVIGYGLLNDGNNTSDQITYTLSNDGEIIDVNDFDSTINIDNFSEEWTVFFKASGCSDLDEQGSLISILNSWNYSADVTFQNQYLYKINSDGGLVEEPIFILEGDSTHYYQMTGVRVDPNDGNYLVHGQDFHVNSMGNIWSERAILMKFTPEGEMLYEVEYEDNIRRIGDVLISDAGGYWLNTQMNSGIPNATLIRVDAQGNELARVTLDWSAYTTGGFPQVETAPNTVVFIGKSYYPYEEVDPDNSDAGYFFSIEYTYDPLTGSIEQTGELKPFNAEPSLDNIGIEPVKVEDGYVFVGSELGPVPYDGGPDDPEELWTMLGTITKLNLERDSVWSRHLRHQEGIFVPSNFTYYPRSELYGIKTTPDGGFVCLGTHRAGQFDEVPQAISPWVIKVDEFGCLEPGCQFVGIEELVVDLMGSLSVYPNPAQTSVNVKIDAPHLAGQTSGTELVMHDSQGRIVLRQPLTAVAGEAVTLDVSNLPTGMYIVHWVKDNVWLDSERVVVE